MEKRSYIAFVSYRHTPQDAAVAKAVHRLIEEYVIPRPLRKNGKKHLGLVFRDEEELPVSSDLTDSICQALDRSRYLVVVCSEAARESQWVAREVQYFLQHHDRENVFVVLVQGEPQNVFPPEVTHIVNPETGEVGDVEPLAIDARGSDGPSSVKKLKKQIKKLYAAMLGCAYDTLVQRDKKRRARQRAVLLSAAGAVVLLFMGMLLLKNGQLEDKNRQLLQINNEVLLRESQLLAANANEALSEQNIVEAVKLAVDALPSDTQDRPYHAPAEAVLMQTVGPFGADSTSRRYAIRDVNQTTPVEDLYLTEDGKYLLTVDEYGKLICYNADDGVVFWSRDLSQEEALRYEFGYIPNQFLSVTDDGLAVVVYEEVLVAVRVETGMPEWIYIPKKLLGMYSISPEGNRVSFLSGDNAYYGLDDEDIRYHLITLSLTDGREISRAEVVCLEGGSGMGVSKPQGTFGDMHNKNCIYLDNSTVVGGYLLTETAAGAEKQEHYVYFRANIETGEAKELFRYDFNEGFHNNELVMIVPIDGKNVLSVYYYNIISENFLESAPGEQGARIWIQMADGENGNILWETELGKEEEYFTSRRLYIFRQGNQLILGISRYLFSVDILTGKETAYQRLETELACMFSVDVLFAYVLRDGTYSLCWRSNVGFSAREQVKLGEAEQLAVCGQGFLRADVIDGMVQPVYAFSPAEGAGRLAAVGTDNPGAVKIYTGLELPQWTERTVDLGTGNISYTNTLLSVVNEDVLCLGPVRADVEDSSVKYWMMLLNIRNDSVQNGPQLSDYIYINDVYPLQDGSGYIMNDLYRNTVLRTEDHIAMISDGTEPDVSGSYGLLGQIQILIGTDASAILRDGRVLTARLHNGQVKLFYDAKLEKIVTVPEEISNENIRHFMEPCGKVLLYAQQAEAASGKPLVALYDAAADRWDLVKLTECDSNIYVILPGAQKDLLLVQGEDGWMQMYDARTGKMLVETKTDVTQNNLLSTTFFHQDQYLLLTTKDSQMFVYDTDTLEEVKRYRFTGQEFDRPAFVQEDEKNHRAYLSCDGAAVCVDMRSWETLFEIDNFLYFDEKDGEVYQYDSRYSGDGLLVVTKVPSMEELADRCRQMLEENGG